MRKIESTGYGGTGQECDDVITLEWIVESSKRSRHQALTGTKCRKHGFSETKVVPRLCRPFLGRFFYFLGGIYGKEKLQRHIEHASN